MNDIELNFAKMILGVQCSLSLDDEEKAYIIEILQDQLRIEKMCKEMHWGPK